MYADLHCHTVHSDGSFTPEELVRTAADKKLPVIAITDHDILFDCPEILALGTKLGVRVVPGLELSTYDPKTGSKAHILVYGVKNEGDLRSLCKTTCDNREKAGEIMLERVQKYYPCSRERAFQYAQHSPALFKQHIMLALMEAGYTDQMYGPLFKELFDSKTGTIYETVSYPNVHEALELIRKAGGTAVMAHPSEYNGQELMRQLAASGEIDGIEIWHPRNPPEEVPGFMETAERFGLIMTGGTDFHGEYSKRYFPLGSYTTPKEQWERLAERL